VEKPTIIRVNRNRRISGKVPKREERDITRNSWISLGFHAEKFMEGGRGIRNRNIRQRYVEFYKVRNTVPDSMSKIGWRFNPVRHIYFRGEG